MVNIWLMMVIIGLMMVNNYNLVGGIPTPLKNRISSVGMIIPFPTEWKDIKFHGSKPPTDSWR